MLVITRFISVGTLVEGPTSAVILSILIDSDVRLAEWLIFPAWKRLTALIEESPLSPILAVIVTLSGLKVVGNFGPPLTGVLTEQ